MPELPDVLLYIETLKSRILNQRLERIRLASPFVVRSVSPPISAAANRTVRSLRRLAKQIVIELDGSIFLVIHLMIAGRFQWRAPGAKIPGKVGLAAFDFSSGTLVLTEAGSKKRASIHVVQGAEGLAAFDRGALEVIDASEAAFRKTLTSENHTLKRALTDPRLFSGIGNAYSDEILHAAKLSPMKLTQKLTGDEISRLHAAVKETLSIWIQRLKEECGDEFPAKVTAFRPEMAVHGRYGQECPVCHSPVQRIVYAENECNYCATCQTDGKLLADRALSRLLKEDWPRSLDEWEAHFQDRR